MYLIIENPFYFQIKYIIIFFEFFFDCNKQFLKHSFRIMKNIFLNN